MVRHIFDINLNASEYYIMKHYLTWDHYREFTTGSSAVEPNSYELADITDRELPLASWKFRVFKKTFDVACALVGLPLIGLAACVLVVINPLVNPGPLFFSQQRVGQFGKTFTMWKFRTMIPAKIEARDPTAALEEDRIPKVGRILRKTRIDEFPNFFNVLRGEMSVVGPRPDALSHATFYANSIAGYAYRHRVLPGITGLAQVEQGYVEDADATALKAKYDNMYVTRYCGRLDIYIIRKTFGVILRGLGR
jgi:lipopolysaccharide/colanic/teichoic acid biosynthesis glycosyltransferase